ncbi:hypothetical protein QFC20_007585 [Naganishia adeliensis]|uniref:Uncharacterized protein n=1 Tax=Naganishia adeliensis TaxID=92952 RepID=A0ACC2UX77_9TREE|nr:hypothetical protein QFC20_007585 [Naganishia adeliensis]
MASVLPPIYETSSTSTASLPTYTPRPTSPIPTSLNEDAPSTFLPEYTSESTTEPHTLSKTLFCWGFLCPFLWMLGISILWIDLKADDTLEQDQDAGEVSVEDLVKREQERQVMDEKIGIVRKAELRWSRYCVVALSIELVVVCVIVGIVVAASLLKE